METNVSIIPSFESSKAELALRDIETLKAALIPLAEKAKAIVVESPEQYAEAGALLKQIRDNRKQGEELTKPLSRVIQNIKDWIQTVKLQHQNQCEQTESILEQKMVAQKAREREAAAAEERRINAEFYRQAEERAKEHLKNSHKEIEAAKMSKRERVKELEAAEAEAEAMKNAVQTVTVAPSTPKIAGLRQRVQWRFKIVDETKIPRSFMTPNETAIGQFVRTAKSKELSEKTIPGIEVWWEDAV